MDSRLPVGSDQMASQVNVEILLLGIIIGWIVSSRCRQQRTPASVESKDDESDVNQSVEEQLLLKQSVKICYFEKEIAVEKM